MNRNVSGTLSEYDMLSVRDGCFQVLVGNPISPMQAIVQIMSEEVWIGHVLRGAPRSDFPGRVMAQPQIIMLQRGFVLMGGQHLVISL